MSQSKLKDWLIKPIEGGLCAGPLGTQMGTWLGTRLKRPFHQDLEYARLILA